jgi:hypothetical protein
VHKAGLTGSSGAGTTRLYEEGAAAVEKAEDILPGLVPGKPKVQELQRELLTGPLMDNLFTDDYLTKKLDFVNLKQAGLILAEMMARELRDEAGNCHGELLCSEAAWPAIGAQSPERLTAAGQAETEEEV